MNILDQIAIYTRERIEEEKRKLPLSTIKQQALSMDKKAFVFEDALKRTGISFICECKKASPSKGVICPDFNYLDIAQEYQKAGADCISVLTEPKWFLGCDNHLKEIASMVSIPCLRKDFTIDEYMIYQAKILGASAVLLICSLLSQSQIKEYINICDALGLSALVEVHDKDEIQTALKSNARIIGVNNRNLKDFSINIENSCRLRKDIPSNIIFIAESGIKNSKDIIDLEKENVDAVLIGEALMKSTDKKHALNKLRSIQ